MNTLTSTAQRIMDDLSLIQAFIEGFTQGEAALLSNPNLRAEPVFDTIQLLAKKEGLIATAKLTEKLYGISVKQSSSYWELIHQVMLAKSFFPVGASQKEEFYSYQHRTIPAGYELNCTTATELFQKLGWSHTRRTGLGISMDLLILCRGASSQMATWLPLKGLVCGYGALYIKTLGSEEAFKESDLVVWLKKVEKSSAATSSYAGVRPGLRSLYRPRA